MSRVGAQLPQRRDGSEEGEVGPNASQVASSPAPLSVFGLRKTMGLVSGRYPVGSVVFRSRQEL